MDSYTLYIYSLTIFSGVIFLLLIIFMFNDFVIFYKKNQEKRKLNKIINQDDIVPNISHRTNINQVNKVEPEQENKNLYILKEATLDNIKRLNSINIFSIKELQSKANKKEDIDVLSKKTGIRKRLLEDWVRLGEFSRIQGIRQEHINLFEKIGIKTIHELKVLNPEDLHLILYDLKKQGTIESDIPTIGMISRWIRLSKDTPIKLDTIENR